MRKLASIQRIWDISPIDGADRLELAKVLGWQCVVNKGEFEKYDLCVYFEVDSFLPMHNEFEFLKNTSYKNSNVLGEGYKLRTLKLRGQISQGLCLSPDKVFSEDGKPLSEYDLQIGMDVTDIIGVRKWVIEEMATTGGTVIGTLPDCVPHTDETRIQQQPTLLDEFGDSLEYYITTKMDGSSHSVCIIDGEIHITGHNYEYLDDGKCSFYEYIKKNHINDRLLEYYNQHKAEQHMVTMTVQGEYCGAGIQKNRLKLSKPNWFVFTVLVNGKRVGLDYTSDLCKNVGLTMVPIEERGVGLRLKYQSVDDLLKRAEGKYDSGSQKEGIVVRTTTPVHSNTESGWLSMKVINNKYLLKNDD